MIDSAGATLIATATATALAAAACCVSVVRVPLTVATTTIVHYTLAAHTVITHYSSVIIIQPVPINTHRK